MRSRKQILKNPAGSEQPDPRRKLSDPSKRLVRYLVWWSLGKAADLEPFSQGQKGVETLLLHPHLALVHEVQDHPQLL